MADAYLRAMADVLLALFKDKGGMPRHRSARCLLGPFLINRLLRRLCSEVKDNKFKAGGGGLRGPLRGCFNVSLMGRETAGLVKPAETLWKKMSAAKWEKFFDKSLMVHFTSHKSHKWHVHPLRRRKVGDNEKKKGEAYTFLGPKFCPRSFFSEETFHGRHNDGQKNIIEL